MYIIYTVYIMMTIMVQLLFREGAFSRSLFCLPMILRCHMLRLGVFLASFTVEVFTIRPTWDRIVVPKQAALSQLWKQQLDNVLERLWEQRICLGKSRVNIKK